MKIAHLTTHINMGGIPVYIYTLAKALQAQGIEQIVISSGGSMEPAFIEKGIPAFCFNLKTKFEFHLKLFSALPKIIKLLKSHKVDLIHAHTRVGQVLAALIEKISGIPCVSTCHGIFQPRLGRRLFPAWGQKIIAISDSVKNHLIEVHGISEKKILRIQNGIELERFVPAANPALKEKARSQFALNLSHSVICMISRAVAPKGFEDFLETVQILAAQNINLRGIIVGDGPDLALFRQRAVELGIEEKIIFTGNLSDVAPVLAASDIFVHPIRVPEGFGLSIAEAMAMALPVIVTDQWALMHLMKDKNIGEIVSVRNPRQIAAIIENWLHQPEKMKLMGQNARAAALEFFDIKRVAGEVLKMYSEVLRVDKSA